MDAGHFEEKRKHKRVRASFIVTYKLRATIPVRLRTAEQNFTAVAVDISLGGLGAIVTEAVPIGQPVQISFALLNDQPTAGREMRHWFELTGKPLHCTLRPRAGYHVGIQFDEIPQEDMEFIADYIEVQQLKKASA